jgi:hypothetical protein
MMEECAVIGQTAPCMTYGQWGFILLGIVVLMGGMISIISWILLNRERDRIDPDHTHTIIW